MKKENEWLAHIKNWHSIEYLRECLKGLKKDKMYCMPGDRPLAQAIKIISKKIKELEEKHEKFKTV